MHPGRLALPPCVRQHRFRTSLSFPVLSAWNTQRHTQQLLQPSSAVVSAASSEQAPYRSLPHMCESLLTTLFLLSKSNPLHWASIWFWAMTIGMPDPRAAFVLNFSHPNRDSRLFSCCIPQKNLEGQAFPALNRSSVHSGCTETRQKQTNLPLGILRPSEPYFKIKGVLLFEEAKPEYRHLQHPRRSVGQGGPPQPSGQFPHQGAVL